MLDFRVHGHILFSIFLNDLLKEVELARLRSCYVRVAALSHLSLTFLVVDVKM